MISNDQIIEAARKNEAVFVEYATGGLWTEFKGDSLNNFAMQMYKQGLTDAAAKCEYIGNTYALDCAEAIRQMAEEVTK